MGPRRKRPRSRSIHAVSNRHEVLSSLFPSIRVIRCYLLREEIDDGYVPACVRSAVILDKRCSFRVSLWFVGSWIDVCYRRLWKRSQSRRHRYEFKGTSCKLANASVSFMQFKKRTGFKLGAMLDSYIVTLRWINRLKVDRRRVVKMQHYKMETDWLKLT